MSTLVFILGIVLTIIFVVGTHEAGHLTAAKLLGVRVLRFSIGFGKPLFRLHDKSGTEYIIALIPLGGYVRMLDENEGHVAANDLPRAYNRQPFYKKFLIVLAGPASNFICAFFLYWAILVSGYVTMKPIIGTVTPRSIAAEAGITPKQEIIGIDHQATASWTTILFRLMTHLGNQDRLALQTTDHTYTLDLSNWRLNELNPDPLASLGIEPFTPAIPLVIGIIKPDSPAAHSPLKLGDRIIAINKRPVQTWDEIVNFVYQHPDTIITMAVARNSQKLDVSVRIGHQRDFFLQKRGLLGISPHFTWPNELLKTIQYGPIAAISHAWQSLVDLTHFNLLMFGKMFTGKLSLQSLGGPITIFSAAGNALNSGLIAFISFLAFLSVSLGVINLLPIPGLDGGHLFIQFIECIMQRSIPERYLYTLWRLGFIFILFILIQAVMNDILRMH